MTSRSWLACFNHRTIERLPLVLEDMVLWKTLVLWFKSATVTIVAIGYSGLNLSCLLLRYDYSTKLYQRTIERWLWDFDRSPELCQSTRALALVFEDMVLWKTLVLWFKNARVARVAIGYSGLNLSCLLLRYDYSTKLYQRTIERWLWDFDRSL